MLSIYLICNLLLLRFRQVRSWVLSCGQLPLGQTYALLFVHFRKLIFPFLLNQSVAELLDVILVPIEQILDRVPSEQARILLNLFSIQLFSYILVGEWGPYLGEEGGLYPLVNYSLPVDILKPDVWFDLVWAIQTKPVWRLSLESFVDEICSLHAPALR